MYSVKEPLRPDDVAPGRKGVRAKRAQQSLHEYLSMLTRCDGIDRYCDMHDIMSHYVCYKDCVSDQGA